MWWHWRKRSFTFRFSSFTTKQSLIFQNSFVLTFTSFIHVHFGVPLAFGHTNQCTIPELIYGFYANPLLFHSSHFSGSVRSQNRTNTASHKCTDKKHDHSRQNAAWQNGSYRVELAIPSGAKLYYEYKRLSGSIQILRIFGERIVRSIT